MFSLRRAAFIPLALIPNISSGQALPFRVSVIELRGEAAARQLRPFRADPAGREVLYCVEAWATRSLGVGIDVITIQQVRHEADGAAHRVADVRDKCRAPDGSALPTIHTHSDGNCQFSPADLVAVAVRDAPFDGVQCGKHYFIWTFAWQVRALAAAADRQTYATRP